MIEIILKLFQQPKPIFVNSSTSPYLTIKQGLYLEKESSRNTHKSKRTTNQQQSPVCTLVSLFVCVFVCVILASYSPHLLHKETLRLDLHRTARQTSKQTNKQTNRQTNKQTGKHEHTRASTRTDRQTDRQAGRQACAYSQTKRWDSSHICWVVHLLISAGTITHSLDWRKSAGAFVHGFRYTSKKIFLQILIGEPVNTVATLQKETAVFSC